MEHTTTIGIVSHQQLGFYMVDMDLSNNRRLPQNAVFQYAKHCNQSIKGLGVAKRRRG